VNLGIFGTQSWEFQKSRVAALPVVAHVSDKHVVVAVCRVISAARE